jgi:hypothetical protein
LGLLEMNAAEGDEMDCHDWQDLLQQHLDGDVPAEVLDRHLHDCPACRGQRGDLQRLIRGLALLQPPSPPPGLADHLTACLCAEFKASRARAWRRRVASLAGLAAAVLLLLAVGLWSWWPVAGQPLEPKPGPRTARVPPQEQPKPEQPKPEPPKPRRESARGGSPDLAPVTDLKPLRESARGVSSGLAPVTDSAHRAVKLFFRDLPLSGGAQPPEKKPG